MSSNDLFCEPPGSFHEVLELAQRKQKAPRVYLKQYWKLLLLVALFYIVPSIQFVLFQYYDKQQTKGAGAYCYYNFKCNQVVLGIESFNNVISNIGYVFVGFFYLIFVRLSDKRSEEESDSETTRLLDGSSEVIQVEGGISIQQSAPTKGLHKDYSLYYCLGWTLVLEGVFSALYHVCPSRINFQFDSTFMTIGVALLFITLYQKRQPTVLSGPYRAYGFMGGIILLNVLALVHMPAGLFWTIVMLAFTYLSISGSIHLYYYERLSIDKHLLSKIAYLCKHLGKPRDPFRLGTLIFANICNYTFALNTAIQDYHNSLTQDFPSFVLALIMLDNFIYLGYYVIMKYRSGERVYPRIWILLVITTALCSLAMYYFNIAVTNKFLTPEESEKLNKPCVLFHFFDYHDIWHFLSAFGVGTFFFVVYWLDIDVAQVPRTEIKVF